MDKADVIIIGGGIIGSSIAYYLSKLGSKVLVLEKDDHAQGSAGATDGVVGYHTKKPGDEMELAIESIAMFDSLSKELGMEIEFEKGCGGLQPVEDRFQWDILSGIAEEQRQSGVDIRMISIKEACRIEPQLSPSLYGALYSPTGCKVNPLRLIFAYVRAAKALGAQMIKGTEVTELIKEGGRVTGVRTNRGDFYADQVVNACGSWAARIAQMAGVDMPIKPRKGQLVVTEPIGPFMTCTVQCARYNVIKFRPELIEDPEVLRMGASLSIKQTQSGSLLLGSTREMAGFDRENTLEAVETIVKRAVKFFPALENVNIIRSFAGLRPFTPDGLPILGKVGDVEGFYMAAGHEGDGIALAPVTGKLVAEDIVYGKPSYPLNAFSPDRFFI